MDLGLRGKGAIVTGGSLGIGKAIARELAREGADVAIAARTKPQLDATAREIADETGRRIIPLAADVTSKEQVDAMVAREPQVLPVRIRRDEPAGLLGPAQRTHDLSARLGQRERLERRIGVGIVDIPAIDRDG